MVSIEVACLVVHKPNVSTSELRLAKVSLLLRASSVTLAKRNHTYSAFHINGTPQMLQAADDCQF